MFFPFYITEENGLVLLENKILHKSDQLEERNVILVPVDSTSMSRDDPFLRAYIEHTTISRDEMRTHRAVNLAKFYSFRSFATSQRSTHENKYYLAFKLSRYSLLCVSNMVALCKRDVVLTLSAEMHLKETSYTRASCKASIRPFNSNIF